MVHCAMRKILFAISALLLTCGSASAQWQVPNHSVPIGRGAGTGFKFLAPGVSGTVLTSAGAGSDPTFSTNAGITALTGDGTAAGPGSAALTLSSVIAPAGPIGSATAAPIITFDAKGRLTAVSSATVTPAIGSVTGLGAGVATFLATPSSANLAAAMTDETGTGPNVFAGSPTLTGTPVLAAPSATTLSVGTTNLNSYIARFVGGNANTMVVDNTGQTNTEIDYANNGTVKALTYYDNAAGTFNFRNFAGTGTGFDIGVTRRLTVTATAVTGANAVVATTFLQNGLATVATLPTCNGASEGSRYGVTDATVGSAVFGTALVGGSTVHTSAYCNGTTWVGG